MGEYLPEGNAGQADHGGKEQLRIWNLELRIRGMARVRILSSEFLISTECQRHRRDSAVEVRDGSGLHAALESSHLLSVNWRTSDPSARIAKISP